MQQQQRQQVSAPSCPADERAVDDDNDYLGNDYDHNNGYGFEDREDAYLGDDDEDDRTRSWANNSSNGIVSPNMGLALSTLGSSNHSSAATGKNKLN